MFLKPFLPILLLITSSQSLLTEFEDGSEDGLVCETVECVKAAGTILLAMDTSVDPCQDFYQYACGGFEIRENIPAGESQQSSSTALSQMIKKQLRNLLKKPSQKSLFESTSRQKLRRFYSSCINLESMKINYVQEMRDMVSKMGGLFLGSMGKDVSRGWSLNGALAVYEKFSHSGLFSATVRPDEKNVTQNVIILEQGSLALGDSSRDYYINKSVTDDPILIALTDMLETFAKLIAGEKVFIDRNLILDVIEFDKKRAEIQQTQAELQDRLATYNKVNVTWLQCNFPFLNWEIYFKDKFKAANVVIGKNEQVNLFGIPYFTQLTTLVYEYLSFRPGGKKILQNYLTLRAISNYAKVIGGAFQAAYDNFQVVFSGKLGSKERWELCLDDVGANIGFSLGAMFVEKYFSKEAKSRAETVINETISTFRSRIKKAEWMDEVTRVRALEKADALHRKVGYPDWLFNDAYIEDRYSKLTITDDYIQNQFAAFNYSNFRELSKLRQAPDKSDWQMNPQDVDAYYEPTLNEVVIPAGILMAPFFYTADGIPPALNFGATGGVAGHEITHGFDDSGKQYDKFGNLKQWWEPKADGQFTNRTVCLINKFNAYLLDGQAVNGDQTLGENIADDGGVKVAYEAYKKFEAKNGGAFPKLVGLEGFTHDQLFFIGYAQTWCSIETPAWRKFLISTNPHSPDRFRVTGPLSNSPEFSAAFKCAPGTPMNVGNKCSIW